jgi:hypothetical protein
MNEQGNLSLLLAHAVMRSEIEAAARARLVKRHDRSPLRRSIGRRIIRFGERLAAEPHLQPARSR